MQCKLWHLNIKYLVVQCLVNGFTYDVWYFQSKESGIWIRAYMYCRACTHIADTHVLSHNTCIGIMCPGHLTPAIIEFGALLHIMVL